MTNTLKKLNLCRQQMNLIYGDADIVIIKFSDAHISDFVKNAVEK